LYQVLTESGFLYWFYALGSFSYEIDWYVRLG
jgi:hypothetical protein